MKTSTTMSHADLSTLAGSVAEIADAYQLTADLMQENDVEQVDVADLHQITKALRTLASCGDRLRRRVEFSAVPDSSETAPKNNDLGSTMYPKLQTAFQEGASRKD